MADVSSPVPTIAVFASDRGPGDPERSSLMSQAGSYLARRGARLVCVGEGGYLPVPLITAARTAGGTVHVIADGQTALPPVLRGVPFEQFDTAEARLERIGELASAILALPGSLLSTTALFGTWSAAKGRGKPLPVVMLNRHRAFEVVRGFAGDVLSHAVSGHDRSVQFSDTIEDCWNRLSRLVER